MFIDHPMNGPAAFRRLCVETILPELVSVPSCQPPLGGCVLKPRFAHDGFLAAAQPPLGGCVLKPIEANLNVEIVTQPPLGGCVLKRLPGQ